MAGLKKGTPGGEECRRVHFRYVSTEAGKSWHGYLAGPPCWYLCHTHGKSKPCLKWLTDERVPCTRCASVKPPELIAYVPLYRESDGAPVMVIVYERSADVLAGLMHLHRVTVMREGEKGDTVTIVKALAQKAYSSLLRERAVPVDLEPMLVRMWNVAELTDWYKLTCGESALPPVVGKAPLTPAASTTPKPRAATTPSRRTTEATELPTTGAGEAMKRILDRRKGVIEPSTNGHHNTSEEGQ